MKVVGAAAVTLLVVTPFAPVSPAAAVATGLGGSHASMQRQYNVAKRNNYTFLRSAKQVREFARQERLEKLEGNRDYAMGRVSFPYARSAVKLFVERLAAQYRRATGERLVVTSLTRPVSRQPRNASPLSVHPAGMAVDFRMPAKSAHRRWLEKTLLSLEDRNVLDVTRERRPAHYHVAVFPREYERYVRALGMRR